MEQNKNVENKIVVENSGVEAELALLRAKYGEAFDKAVSKVVKGGSRKGSGVAEEFRKGCPSIKLLENKGYHFYTVTSNFQDLCEKEGIKVSAEELQKFDSIQKENIAVGRFWKEKESK